MVSKEEATEGDAVMVAYMGSPEAIDGAAYPVGPVLAVAQIQARLKKRGAIWFMWCRRKAAHWGSLWPASLRPNWAWRLWMAMAPDAPCRHCPC